MTPGRRTAEPAAAAGRRGRPPAVLTGFGLGAFADGIVLHQVLQWHHLVSGLRSPADVAGLQANTFWDGVFHGVSWLVVVAGVVWLVREGREVAALGVRRVAGLMLVGWGAFHVVDQAVFHLALGAHHIRMVEDYQRYDWGFTAVGVALVGLGLALGRPARPPLQGERPDGQEIPR